jgi:hypothetical protein
MTSGAWARIHRSAAGPGMSRSEPDPEPVLRVGDRNSRRYGLCGYRAGERRRRPWTAAERSASAPQLPCLSRDEGTNVKYHHGHMTAGEIVAIVVGAITIIGAIVSLVRYLRGT